MFLHMEPFLLSHMEDDICSRKQSMFMCNVGLCLCVCAHECTGCVCVRFTGAPLIGSAGRCATEGECAIGCVVAQSASASARDCREGRLLHTHTHTEFMDGLVAGTTAFSLFFTSLPS